MFKRRRRLKLPNISDNITITTFICDNTTITTYICDNITVPSLAMQPTKVADLIPLATIHFEFDVKGIRLCLEFEYFLQSNVHSQSIGCMKVASELL